MYVGPNIYIDKTKKLAPMIINIHYIGKATGGI